VNKYLLTNKFITNL